MNKKNTSKINNNVTAIKDHLIDYLLSLLIFCSIVFQGSYFPYQYLSVLIISCLLLFIIIRKSQPLSIPIWLIILPLALNLCYILSSIFAFNKYDAFLETLKLLNFTVFIFIYFLRKDFRPFYNGILTGCLAVSIIGLLSYFNMINFPNAIIISRNTVRLQSTIQYANITAVFMGIGFFISYYFLNNEKKFINKLKYFVYGFILLTSLVLTFSRATIAIFVLVVFIWLTALKSKENLYYVLFSTSFAYLLSMILNNLSLGKSYGLAFFALIIALSFASVVFYLFEKYMLKIFRFHKLFIFAFIIIIFSALFLITPYMGRLAEYSLKEGTLVERFIYYQDSLTAISHNLILGIGPGNWTSGQYFYQTAQYTVHYVHNGIIQFALDGGIFAAISFITLIIIFYLQIFKTSCSIKDKLYPIIIVTFILLHSLVDIDLSFASILIILAGCFIILLRETAFKHNVQIHKKLIGNSVLVLVISLSIVLLIGQIFANQSKNDYLTDNLDKSLSLCKSNIFFKPFDGENYYLMAEILIEQKDPNNTTINYLNTACSLDRFNPLYKNKLCQEYSNLGRYKEAFENSLQLIDIQPLKVENYEMALLYLKSMTDNGIITKNDFDKYKENISYKQNTANKKITPLSRYIKNQKPISINLN